MPVGLSSTWWVKKADVGSLPTCDHVASSKSVQVFSVPDLPYSWTDSPAYIPIADNGNYGGANTVSDSETTPWAFHLNLFPGFLSTAQLYISQNTLSSGFEVWLARDGPTQGDTSATPVDVKRIFNIPIKTDSEYNVNNKYPLVGEGDVVPMFGGHSYGYVLRTDGDVVPTGTFKFTIWTAIYYGGAGS